MSAFLVRLIEFSCRSDGTKQSPLIRLSDGTAVSRTLFANLLGIPNIPRFALPCQARCFSDEAASYNMPTVRVVAAG